MKLENLQTLSHPRGVQRQELFSNGYGISVIPEYGNCGQDLYEVAVLTHKEGRHTHLTYETEITNDVIRYCTVEAVNTLIERVRNLT